MWALSQCQGAEKVPRLLVVKILLHVPDHAIVQIVSLLQQKRVVLNLLGLIAAAKAVAMRHPITVAMSHIFTTVILFQGISGLLRHQVAVFKYIIMVDALHVCRYPCGKLLIFIHRPELQHERFACFDVYHDFPIVIVLG